MSRALHVQFEGLEDTKKELQIVDPKEGLTPEDVKAAADAVIANKVFLAGLQPVVKYTKAYIREISDTELYDAAE